MKRSLFIVAVGSMVLSSSLFAQDKYDDHRARFEKLKSNSAASPHETRQIEVDGARFDVPSQRIDIDPVPNVDPNKDPYQCGIAVWFQLENGRYVNPVKHRWDPEERFHIWIEPAVPVTISLHQNYPEDRPPSRQVYPDAEFPKTFMSFPAGRSSKLPVRFKMDDDLRNEIMSMVVVRTDCVDLPLNKIDGDGTSGPGGTLRTAAAKFTEWNDEALLNNTIRGENSRFDIVGPGANKPEFSDRPEDVQFFMLGVGSSHQFQLTLFK